MDTASIQFVMFGLAVAIVSNLSRSRMWRSAVLLLASLGLLGMLDHRLVDFFPLVGFLVVGYAGLGLVEHGWAKFQASIIVAVVLAFVWLKRYTFLPERSFLHFSYFTVGLSYIFFRVLHLIIEAADRGRQQRIGIGRYLLYTLNFTTLVSGPIQRYDEFMRDQFSVEPISLGPRVVGLQLERIIAGFFKVNVLSVVLNMVVVDAIAQLSRPVSPMLGVFAAVRLGVVYPFYLYANFSGYIDIVIALARLMRVRLPENFDRPFSASSFLDFWNRWHITLSFWLRTYVYNTLLLALMRRIDSVVLQPLLGVVCFFVTFFLVGIWHGRTSEFVFFGVLLGAGVSINKLWQLWMVRAFGRKSYKMLATSPVYIALGRGFTFSWFALTCFWFWGNWRQLHNLLTAIGLLRWLVVWMAIWLCATCVLAFWEWMRAMLLSVRTTGGPVVTHRYSRVVYASALGLAAFVITILLSQPPPGVVYKAF